VELSILPMSKPLQRSTRYTSQLCLEGIPTTLHYIGFQPKGFPFKIVF
jgi:hypothetical protein